MKDLWGNEYWPEAVKARMREVMIERPEAIDDEDLLAAICLGDESLAEPIRRYRRYDYPRRRRELAKEPDFAWSEDEAERRQKAARR